MVPIVGKLTDIYGRKRFFIGGIALFIVGSVLAGLSQTMDQLIAFRAIQGAGGGVIMANGSMSTNSGGEGQIRAEIKQFVLYSGQHLVEGHILHVEASDPNNAVSLVNVSVGRDSLAIFRKP